MKRDLNSFDAQPSKLKLISVVSELECSVAMFAHVENHKSLPKWHQTPSDIPISTIHQFEPFSFAKIDLMPVRVILLLFSVTLWRTCEPVHLKMMAMFHF